MRGLAHTTRTQVRAASGAGTCKVAADGILVNTWRGAVDARLLDITEDTHQRLLTHQLQAALGAGQLVERVILEAKANLRGCQRF